MNQAEDKVGLDRSVLSYTDVSLQPKGKYYLVIDEGMGQRALFSIDQLAVTEFEITGYRDKPTIQTVVRFSPQLPWRLISSSEVYLQDSKTVYEREIAEQKEVHDLTAAVRKQLRPANTAEADPQTEPGQYL